jgi:hypothetical protein
MVESDKLLKVIDFYPEKEMDPLTSTHRPLL